MKKKFLACLLALCLIFSLAVPAMAADFSDTEGHWAKDSIDRWAAVGVLNGKSADTFDPDGNMTRAEFAQMLCNLMGYTKKAENTFTDVPDDAWYADAILKLVAAGVLNGVGDNMAAPNAPITREQAAVMLCRAFNIKISSTSMSFADADSVSDWARGAVATLTSLGMISGVGDNQVAPQLNINRASVAKLIDNMVAEYVTESKTVTGEVDGVIIVAAGVTVTLSNADVSLPVIVAPKADNATVAVTGSSTVDSIVVEADGASVTVSENAKVDTVDVNGANAAVSGSGDVANVIVGENASNTKVTTAGTVVENNSDTDVTIADGGTIAAGETEKTPEKKPQTSTGGGGGGSTTTTKYALNVKTTQDKNVTGTEPLTVKIGDAAITGSTEVPSGSTTVTVVCKKNIAVVLMYEGATGDTPTMTQTGNATDGFTYTITFNMPKKEATLVIGILNACEANATTTVGLSACNAGTNDNLGAIIGDAIDGLTFTEGEFKPAETYKLNVKTTQDKNVTGTEPLTVKIGDAVITDSTKVLSGSTTVTVECKKNIAVVLMYDGATGDAPTMTQTGNASTGFTYTITFDMPEQEASLVIGILNACEADATTTVGLSACNAGENSNLGAIIGDAIDGLTFVNGEFKPADSNLGGGGGGGGATPTPTPDPDPTPDPEPTPEPTPAEPTE